MHSAQRTCPSSYLPSNWRVARKFLLGPLGGRRVQAQHKVSVATVPNFVPTTKPHGVLPNVRMVREVELIVQLRGSYRTVRALELSR